MTVNGMNWKQAKGTLDANLSKSAVRPSILICSIAVSIVMHVREQRPYGVLSLMQCPESWNKSTIRHHLFGWWFLGITPNLLNISTWNKTRTKWITNNIAMRNFLCNNYSDQLSFGIALHRTYSSWQIPGGENQS